jgi:hypothetical protein
MEIKQLTKQFQHSMMAFLLAGACPSGALAQTGHSHETNSQTQQLTQAQGAPTRPQTVICEAMPDGHLPLIGADFLVIASDWDKAHSGQGAPQLMGQLFHDFESPNRFGLPAFYTLHVWAWKENPSGAFVNWHPNVSCQSFAGR